MFSYTLHTDPEIQQQIERDLEQITFLIREITKGPLCGIILYGAFGRGEGRVVKSDKGITYINDLDLLLVFDDGFDLSPKEARSIRVDLNRLGRTDGHSFLDIKSVSCHSLQSAPFTMDYFDIKHGSHIIWGRPDLLALIPDYSGSQMPWVQGKRLLMNRLATFFEAKMALEQESPCELKSAFCNYQCSKVALACLDAYLILNSVYTTKYRDKVTRVQNIQLPETLVSLIERAVQIKTGVDPLDVNNPVEFWEKTGTAFYSTVRDFFNADGVQHSEEYERVLAGESLIVNIYRSAPSVRRYLKQLLLFKRDTHTPRQYLETIELLLLHAIFAPGTERDHYLQYAHQWLIKYLGESDSNIISSNDVNDLVGQTLNLWYDQFHLGIPTFQLWR
ncbi:MAG: hypothetical protein GY845_38175 [Planctomycetes bacterium]|nr:hypothetical protein [Planctomycetota bacterium]